MKHTTLSTEANEILKRAITNEQENRWENAIELYKEVVLLEPESLRLWRQLGYLLSKSGKQSEAQQAYETALALDPVDIITIRALSLIYIKNGRSAEAEELLQAAIARDDLGTLRCSVYLDLSHILLLQKRWDEAKACLLNAVLADPSSQGAY